MKKSLFVVAVTALLTACSASNESKQSSNDDFQEKAGDLPNFNTLQTGGVNLPAQDPTYQLPTSIVKSSEPVDIRPPVSPLAIIKNSVAQFDGERAFIAYPVEKQNIYSIAQVERLLKEQNISYKKQGDKILTDWASTSRSDEIGDTQIRYQIEQVISGSASALVVLVLEMKRDDVIFTPKRADKRRYASERLNLLVSELDSAYKKQRAALTKGVLMPIDSALTTDINNRVALLMGAPFEQAWFKLGTALPKLGFEIEEETIGRGNRVLEYKPLDNKDWLRISSEKIDLDKDTYFMQLSAVGNRSSVVITDEEGNALSGKTAQIVYTALKNVLAK